MEPFPFFRLSRELRDQIYAELGTGSAEFEFGLARLTEEGRLVSCQIEYSMSNLLRATVSSMPVTNFALVSRQFKDEYDTELRRHTCVKIEVVRDWNIHLDRDILAKGSKSHRYFRRIPRVELRMWHPGQDGYSHEQYDQVRELLMPYMPNLKSFTQDLLFKLPSSSHGLGPDDCPVALNATTFADRPVLLADGANTIPLKIRVYLSSALVSINPNNLPFRDDPGALLVFNRDDPEGIRRWLQDSRTDNIVYRATPAKGEGMVWGLDLVAEDREKVWDWKVAVTPSPTDVRILIKRRLIVFRRGP